MLNFESFQNKSLVAPELSEATFVKKIDRIQMPISPKREPSQKHKEAQPLLYSSLTNLVTNFWGFLWQSLAIPFWYFF